MQTTEHYMFHVDCRPCKMYIDLSIHINLSNQLSIYLSIYLSRPSLDDSLHRYSSETLDKSSNVSLAQYKAIVGFTRIMNIDIENNLFMNKLLFIFSKNLKTILWWKYWQAKKIVFMRSIFPLKVFLYNSIKSSWWYYNF